MGISLVAHPPMDQWCPRKKEAYQLAKGNLSFHFSRLIHHVRLIRLIRVGFCSCFGVREWWSKKAVVNPGIADFAVH
jgi:hypothetical protein